MNAFLIISLKPDSVKNKTSVLAGVKKNAIKQKPINICGAWIPFSAPERN
jgi:hypothetical protein